MFLKIVSAFEIDDHGINEQEMFASRKEHLPDLTWKVSSDTTMLSLKELPDIFLQSVQ